MRSLQPHPRCYGTEYTAALSAVNDAIRTRNGLSHRRKEAASHFDRYISQWGSRRYYEAKSKLREILAAESVAFAAYDTAMRARERAQDICLSNPRLVPAPTCTSLVFPAPFPGPGGRREFSQLPCPSLWTVLEVAAASQLAPLPCAALCLPADAAADVRVVRERFRRLAKVLHPDRWHVTWAAELARIPAAWVSVLEPPPRGGTVAGSFGVSVCGYKRWSAADVQAAAGAAFVAAREAYESLVP